jgi:hypothetical protein
LIKHLCDSEFPWCPPDARAGELYKLRVNHLSPTQFAVEKAEVHVRAGRMRKKLKNDPGHLHDYLRVRPVPIIVRGERFYLVDQDILAGRHTFGDCAFSVDEHGTLSVTDDGKEVLEEALFLATGAEARGLRGYRGAAI